MELSSRVESLKASATLALNQKAKELSAQGKPIVNLTAGEPDFLTPEPVQKAAIEAVKSGKHFYCPASGISELRQAIANTTESDYGRKVSPDQVVVTCGAKQALFNYFFSVLNPGDEVIVFAPYWVTYTELIKICQGKPVIVNTSQANGFEPSIEALEAAITEKTKCVVLNSPCNPTGAVYSDELIEALTAFFQRNPGIKVLTDDIYSKLYFDSARSKISVASSEALSWDQVTIVHGVSKTYSMTGWRLGWMVSNLSLASAVGKLQSQVNSGTSSISQWAAYAALTENQNSMLSPMKDAFAHRRDLVCERAEKLKDIDFVRPKGAFYLFLNLSKIIEVGNHFQDDLELCSRLLERYNIAVVPGSAFGAPGYIRLSFATSEENLTKAFDAFEKFVHDLDNL